jgi:hypothetical protein
MGNVPSAPIKKPQKFVPVVQTLDNCNRLRLTEQFIDPLDGSVAAIERVNLFRHQGSSVAPIR